MPVKKYTSLGLKGVGLGLVIAAGCFWAKAGMYRRPKYLDEQTLVGGTIWSQVIIPIGLIMSSTVDTNLDTFIHGYFVMAGMILLFSTGITLIVYEALTIVKRRRSVIRRTYEVAGMELNVAGVARDELKYDKDYLCIGILTLMAGIFTLADFIVLLI